MTVALVFADGLVVAEHGSSPTAFLARLGEVGLLDEVGVPDNAHDRNVEPVLSETEAPYPCSLTGHGTPVGWEAGGGPELPSDDARDLYAVPDLDREPIQEFAPSRRPTETDRLLAAAGLAGARERLARAKEQR